MQSNSIHTGNFYVLDAQYINRIDPSKSFHIQSTKGGQRPFYLAVKCIWDETFYWVVPIGHDTGRKYLRLSKRRPDLIRHSSVRGEDSFYLVSNMIPVRAKCFVREFTSNGVPMTLGKSEQRIVGKMVRRSEALLRQGKPLYPHCPDWYNYIMLGLDTL